MKNIVKHLGGPPDDIEDLWEAFSGDFPKIKISSSRSLFTAQMSTFYKHFRGEMVDFGLWGVL